MRVASADDLLVLALPSRQRVQWRRSHAKLVYLACAATTAICAVLQVHQLIR
jgi:hypothetical protein